MSFRVVVGDDRADREREARRLAAEHALTVDAPVAPARWTFERNILPPAPSGRAVVWLPDLHLAFPSGQRPGTRLVLTQSTYQLQRWLDLLAGAPHLGAVAHASRRELQRRAPEAFAGRGPWSHIELIERSDGGAEPSAEDAPATDALWTAFDRGRPEERIAASRTALEADPGNPALHLALASALIEVQDMPSAQREIETALEGDRAWEAVWFEYGKLWLRADDLERAADCFAEATRLMPTFAAALSNLGAALAETERPEEAIEALEKALRYDPRSHQTLNNLAVIYREEGRLDEAVETARRAIALAPEFVFGSYNLAHALFLQGRFREAADTYGQAYARDPQKNVVQGLRTAVARGAAGDVDAAAALLEETAFRVPEDERADALEEAEETLTALAALGREQIRPLLERVQELRGRRS